MVYLAALVAMCCAADGAALEPGDHVRIVRMDDEERSSLVHLGGFATLHMEKA